MSKYLVAGAGGFIGGHLVKSLLNDGHKVVCADIKPIEYWFQYFDECENFSLDLKIIFFPNAVIVQKRNNIVKELQRADIILIAIAT